MDGKGFIYRKHKKRGFFNKYIIFLLLVIFILLGILLEAIYYHRPNSLLSKFDFHVEMEIQDNVCSLLVLRSNGLIPRQFYFPEIKVNVSQIMAFNRTITESRESQPLQNANKNWSTSSIKRPNFSAFQPRLSVDERQALLMVFQTFIGLCIRNNLTFFLYGGSLLGAYRHHDLVPWDDDVDVMMNATDKDNLGRAVSSLGEDFEIFFHDSTKFFSTKSSNLPHKSFSWPYVDIFFFRENQTHIFDEHPSYRDDFVFPKSHVFPLTYRIFAGVLLPVPLCTKSFLDQNYTPSLCKASSYSHKLEANLPAKYHASVPCAHLQWMHPFVSRPKRSHKDCGTDSRHDISEACRETEILKFGNHSLHVFSLILNSTLFR